MLERLISGQDVDSAGWGMRIIFVPDDSTHEEPEIEVREPHKDER
jgi:hypothetical protein